MNKNITTALKEHSKSLDKIDIDRINTATELITKSLVSGNKVFWCGNGGSAAQANHLSAELIGGMYKDKKAPFKSICLNVDTAFISAWSNDDSFDNIFVRQLEALADSGDVLIALSTSGNSQNIINALNYANNHNATTLAFLGYDGGKAIKIAKNHILVPSFDMQICEDIHLKIGHIIMKYLCDFKIED